MAISSSTRKAGPFVGNDATTVFPFAFKVFTAADLRVVNTSALGIESDLVIDVDYTVSLNENQDNDPGGSVTRAEALPTGERLTITSDVEALQPLVLTNQGGFYPRVINDAFDKITIIAQQLIEQVGRSLKLPISSTASATLPDPVANSLIAWNSSGNGFVNIAPGDLATVAGYADARVETFEGDGVETDFEIDFNPGVLANLDISISGITQVAGVDFTWIGTTITFDVAPPADTVVLVRYARPLTPLPDFDSILTSVADAEAAAALAQAQTDYSLLAAEAAPVGTDLIGVFRAGLKKLTLNLLAEFVVRTAASFLQSGTGAVAEALQTLLRRRAVEPDQFSGTDTEKLLKAFDAAGDVPSQNVARPVRFTRWYDTTATIDVPSYVVIEGIGMGRCGIRPALSSGPGLRASVDEDSSSYLCEWRDFTLDGVNATGSAYGLEFNGQKITTLARVGFRNFDTSEHAAQFMQGCQNVILDQCHFLDNRLHQRIGEPFVSGSFPTTITHRGVVYEGGLETGAEAVLIEDASGCSWDQKCVDQGNLQPVTWRITSSAGQQTAANHKWDNHYHENNETGVVPDYTWSFEGNATKPLVGCVIHGASIHGLASGEAHIYAENTRGLVVTGASVDTAHVWIEDGGGNTAYDIDARYVGECGIQSALYNLTSIRFRADVPSVQKQYGILEVTSITEQADGRYHLNFNRDVKSTQEPVTVTSSNTGADYGIVGFANWIDANTLEVRTAVGAALTDSLIVSVTIVAEIEAP